MTETPRPTDVPLTDPAACPHYFRRVEGIAHVRPASWFCDYCGQSPEMVEHHAARAFDQARYAAQASRPAPRPRIVKVVDRFRHLLSRSLT